MVVLFYFYLGDNNISFSRARSYIFESSEKPLKTVHGNNEDFNTGEVGEKMSGMGEKARTVVTGVDEKVSGTGDWVGAGVASSPAAAGFAGTTLGGGLATTTTV